MKSSCAWRNPGVYSNRKRPPIPTKPRKRKKTPAASTAEVSGVPNQPSKERTEPMNSKSEGSKSEPISLAGQLIPVTFLGATLVLADHNGQPYVVMRALVTAMGLDWRSQYVKLTEKFGSSVVEITTVAEDGKPRTMICLALRKLPGWLYSLNPGKLSAELRPKVLRYQDECDEVLWKHWTGTYVPQHSVANVTLSRMHLAYEREHTRTCLELAKCTELGLGDALYDKYSRLCAQLGARVVSITSMTPGLAQKRLPLEGGAT
ncbi:phage antirepressor N-terminal domain-containing protein [Polaromonas sp. P2-4]|nr:phage antirepressor N-terminal domain-containing protein [Polaromonas sp. P2-4]